jgi:uncharacterized protein YegP (UPF0339 family)
MSAYDGGVTDWIADPELSREEKIARFMALGPELTAGPMADRGARFEIYQAGNGWHFRLRKATGEIVATSGEGYATKEAAISATEQVVRLASQAEIAVA